jgi:hypothetical protein
MKYSRLLKIFFFLGMTLFLTFACRPETNKPADAASTMRLEVKYENGKPQGPFRKFYPDGKLYSNGYYENGKPDGLYQTFTPQGQLASQIEFKDSCIRNWKIYWAEDTAGAKHSFSFVSRAGYFVIRDGMKISVNDNTPEALLKSEEEVQ